MLTIIARRENTTWTAYTVPFQGTCNRRPGRTSVARSEQADIHDEEEEGFPGIDQRTRGAGRPWNGATRHPRGAEIGGPVEAALLEDKEIRSGLCHPPAFFAFCNQPPGFPAITRSPGTPVMQRHDKLTRVHEYRVRLAAKGPIRRLPPDDRSTLRSRLSGEQHTDEARGTASRVTAAPAARAARRDRDRSDRFLWIR